MIAQMFGETKPPLEAVAEMWGIRDYPRRTRGTPARTRALAVLFAYAQEYGLPELESLGEFLASAWAGEEGWDAELVVRAIKAAAAVQVSADSTAGNGRNGKHHRE